MAGPTSCCRALGGYCDRCDSLVGLDGLHLIGVDRDDGGALTVTVKSGVEPMGCPTCGVVAHGHGRRVVRLVDAPAFGKPTMLVWRNRRWVCPEPACPVGSFSEQDEAIARPRALLTVRACQWAIAELRGEHASVQGLARRLGASWRTVWTSIRPLMQAADADTSRFDGVSILGVDEHVWHHVSTKPIELGGRGPKELTGMVDLTPDEHGRTRARLLDLVPGRSGQAYRTWLTERGEAFRPVLRSPPWTRFAGTRTPSMTSSTTPAPSWTPFMPTSWLCRCRWGQGWSGRWTRW